MCIYIYIDVYNARGTSRITKSYVTRGGEGRGEGKKGGGEKGFMNQKIKHERR